MIPPWGVTIRTGTLEVSNKVGVNTSWERFDLDVGIVRRLMYVGEDFSICEQMDRGTTVKEDPVLVDDGVTLLELSHCSTAIVVWNGW